MTGRVRRIAAWDGWCGACAAERPLVLTRTGRRTVRSWWAGFGDDHLVLTLTCRLCGVGVDVPPDEEDDPEVEAVDAMAGTGSVEAEVPSAVVAAEASGGAVEAPGLPVEVPGLPTEVPVEAADPVGTPSPDRSADADLRAARQAVVDVVAALARRSAVTVLPAPRGATDEAGPSEVALDLLTAGYATA